MTIEAKILALIIIISISASLGGGIGYKYHKSITDAQQVEALAKAQKMYKELETKYSQASSLLLQQEAQITTASKEKVRYVYRTTTNSKCLNAATVGVLNSSSYGLQSPKDPTKSSTEGSTTTSSSQELTDTDVAYWIANAQEQYSICAQRQNASVDILLKLEDSSNGR